MVSLMSSLLKEVIKMKGMNTTLVLNEPDTLKAKLHRACAEHSVPNDKRDSIVKSGLELFMVDGSGIYTLPLGKYPNIAEYVKAHRHGAEHGIDLNLTRDQLYNRLIKAAEAGKMVEYRRLRKQYFAA
jgi:hypothetical protein